MVSTLSVAPLRITTGNHDRGSTSGLEAYADIRVLVPRGQRIIIHQAVGDARITMVDADLAIDVASSTVKKAQEAGLNVVYTEEYTRDVRDLSPTLTKIFSVA